MSIISRPGGHRNTEGEGIDEGERKAYNSGSHLKLLRGWVQFPTGGKARELSRKLSRSGDDSGADSTVWMREETVGFIMRNASATPRLPQQQLREAYHIYGRNLK